MEFIISIDTAGDNRWEFGRKLTVENIKFVPRFQNLCEKYHIRPTYLVTSEVCEDSFAKELFSDFRQKNNTEIGCHLHLWSTPPFLDKDGYRLSVTPLLGWSGYKGIPGGEGGPDFVDKKPFPFRYNLLESLFIILQNKNIASVTLTEAAKNSKV